MIWPRKPGSHQPANALLIQVGATGALTLIGTNLGIAITNPNVGFDIASGSGNTYLSAYTNMASPELYWVNLGAGSAKLIGSIPVVNLLVDVAVRFEGSATADIFIDGFESGDLGAWSLSVP